MCATIDHNLPAPGPLLYAVDPHRRPEIASMRVLQNTAVSGPDRGQRRREVTWAWLSLLTLVLCWDASARLEARISPPRVRIAHAGERSESVDAGEGTSDR
jgi:hypothetical protein